MAAVSCCYESLTSSSFPRHDIFLSHSGAQKPFVTSLYDRLRAHYSTFFDKTDHSLPLGEDFPSRIFDAARTCKLAVVVLSEEYLRSKWPMLELCAFVAATPPPTILPLFFKLGPKDLKDKQKLEKWRSIWDEIAKEDSRINVCNWELALSTLASRHGIVSEDSEEESSYIGRVFSRICENVAPSMRYDFSGRPGIHRMFEVFYLELPTDPDEEKLLLSSKNLLKLTNFNNKVDLNHASHLRLVLLPYDNYKCCRFLCGFIVEVLFIASCMQVYLQLRGTDLVACKVFLIVDNITTEATQNFAEGLLRLGLAAGSRVLMVARDNSVLRPLLQGQGTQHCSHYVYGSMKAPGLSREEALQVLLQFGDGMGLPDAHVPETSLSIRYRQVIEEAVHESRIEEQYFPIVLNIMGYHLRRFELVDVENWSRKMKRSFLEKVGKFKKEGLLQLVNESFRALSKNLQTLFLDVALFIIPLSDYLEGEIAKEDAVYSRLSAIQGRQPEDIEMEMDELRRHGFLDLQKCGLWTPTVTVHDFYLEFAASVEEACIYCWSSEAIGVARTKELRTVVLKLGERQEKYEFGPEFTSVKAVVLRNCKALKVLCGTENLTSLASLDLHSCPRLLWVQSPAVGWKINNLRRVTWQNTRYDAETLQSKKLKAVWKRLCRMTLGERRVMGIDGLLLRAKGLEVPRLASTGIRDSVDLSGCLQQLKVLEVWEPNLKGLRVCNLPNLERFSYSADVGTRMFSGRDPRTLTTVRASSVPRKGVLTSRGLLEGCPKLQDVCIRCAAVKDEPQGTLSANFNLRELCVNRLWNVSRPPDVTAAAESLEILKLFDCRELRSLKFGCTFGNLQTLCLSYCPNATEVTGLGRLPCLRELRITECTGLIKMIGVGGLVRLRVFEMSGCPNLHFHSWLRDLVSLIELEVIKYSGPGLMDGLFDVGGFMKLRILELESSDNAMTAGILKIPNNLQRLTLSSNRVDQRTVLPVQATTLLGLAELSQLSFYSISSLILMRLRNLTSLEGIGFLGSLRTLCLDELWNLTSLQGIESLRKLDYLRILKCPSVEGLPVLSALVKLRSLACSHCVKLSSAEGCVGLPRLNYVDFTGCRSLAIFPSWDLKDWKVRTLRITGAKFASVKAAMAWAEDERTPEILRMASLRALRGVLLNKQRNACEMILDRFLPIITTCYTEEVNREVKLLFDYYYRVVSKAWNYGCLSAKKSRCVPNLWKDDVLKLQVPPLHAFKGQPLAHHLSHRRAQDIQVGCQAQPSTTWLTTQGHNEELFRRLGEARCLTKVTNIQFSIFVAYLFYCVPLFDSLLDMDCWKPF